jgi:hypothetical protein
MSGIQGATSSIARSESTHTVAVVVEEETLGEGNVMATVVPAEAVAMRTLSGLVGATAKENSAFAPLSSSTLTDQSPE